MATNKNAVNETVINGPGGRRIDAAASLAGNAQAVASISYVRPTTVVLAGVSTIDSFTAQQFQNELTLTGKATGLAPPSVTRLPTASALALASITAIALGGFGGAEFPTTASVNADISMVTKVTASMLADSAGDNVDANTIVSAGASASPLPEVEFIADPSMVFNGDAFTTHFPVAYNGVQADGGMRVVYDPQLVSTDAVLIFGGAVFDAPGNFKRRITQTLPGACSFTARPALIFYGDAAPTASGTQGAVTGFCYRVAGASTLADAYMLPARPSHRHLAKKIPVGAKATVAVSATFAVRFGGYVLMDLAPGIPAVEATVYRMVRSNPDSIGLYALSPYVWTTVYVEAEVTQNSGFTGWASIQGYDIVTFARAADLNEFDRFSQVKDFTRARI